MYPETGGGPSAWSMHTAGVSGLTLLIRRARGLSRTGRDGGAPGQRKIAMRAVSGFRQPISTLQVLARHPNSCNPTSERIENTSSREPPRPETLMLFTFPEDAHWNVAQ